MACARAGALKKSIVARFKVKKKAGLLTGQHSFRMPVF
jgi:hypothetical protein